MRRLILGITVFTLAISARSAAAQPTVPQPPDPPPFASVTVPLQADAWYFNFIWHPDSARFVGMPYFYETYPQLYNAETGDVLTTFDCLVYNADLAWLDGGRAIYMQGCFEENAPSMARLLDPDTGERLDTPAPLVPTPTPIQFEQAPIAGEWEGWNLSPDGRWLLTWTRQGQAFLYLAATNEYVATLPHYSFEEAGPGFINPPQWSPDSKRLLTWIALHPAYVEYELLIGQPALVEADAVTLYDAPEMGSREIAALERGTEFMPTEALYDQDTETMWYGVRSSAGNGWLQVLFGLPSGVRSLVEPTLYIWTIE